MRVLIAVGLGERAGPIRAGQVCFAVDIVRVIEMIGNFSAGFGLVEDFIVAVRIIEIA